MVTANDVVDEAEARIGIGTVAAADDEVVVVAPSRSLFMELEVCAA